MSQFEGKRIYAEQFEDGESSSLNLSAGEYGVHEGNWYAVTPNGYHANLKGHNVEEHEDGTISVKWMDIRGGDNKGWQGCINNGVWESEHYSPYTDQHMLPTVSTQPPEESNDEPDPPTSDSPHSDLPLDTAEGDEDEPDEPVPAPEFDDEEEKKPAKKKSKKK